MFWARFVVRRTASLWDDTEKSRTSLRLFTTNFMSLPDELQIVILKALPVTGENLTHLLLHFLCCDR